VNWTPRPFQLDALKFLVQNCNGGLLLDPGLGKTSISLALLNFLKSSGQFKSALIIAPLRPLYITWPAEVKKWADFNNLTYTILHGSDKDEKLTLARTDIYLINPEGLKWFTMKGGFEKLGCDVLIVDESTKFKDSSTSRFKLIKPYLKLFKRRVILTGTPAPNGLIDLFGQIYIVDMGRALGRFITHYRNAFFYPSGYGGYDWTLRQGADKEILDRIRASVMRLASKDHIDMPELIKSNIEVDLPPDARRIYMEMEDHFLAEIGDSVVLGVNGAAAGSKCRQIANGGVYDGQHNATHVHDAKTDAVGDLVEQLQENPLLIFYEFIHDLHRLQAKFPNAPCLTGMTGPKLTKAVEAFNEGKIPVLLAHPASAGHGLNLQGSCHHVCFYGITWDLELYDQSIARVWRQGQENEHVFVYHIVARKTLDQVVMKTLLGKDRTQQSFLNALKEDRQ